MKRILPLLIAVCLLLAAAPAPARAASPFPDVPEGASYADSVRYVKEQGYMDGVEDGKFDPDGTLTRGTIVTILHRIEGSPAVSGAPFSDVPDGEWYAPGVAWAAASGIVDGYDNGRFGPTDPLTREQMAVILYRYAVKKNYDVPAGDLSLYSDAAKTDDYAVTAVGWAAANGMLLPSGGRIRPLDDATRAEVAVAIAAFDVKTAGKEMKYNDPAPAAPLPALASAAKKAFRMFPYYWLEDDAFAATCAGLRKYASSIDEITLFCDYMHSPYMSDSMLSEYTSVLTKRIAALKAMGFPSVGINMLQTAGHGDYLVSQAPSMPFPKAVDCQGRTAASQPCLRSQAYRTYIAKKYAAYAACGPDFIWVDDDFRVPDKNVSYICFCDDCLAAFNSRYGTSYSRSTLYAALVTGPDDAAYQQLRRNWSTFNLQNSEEVLGIIKNAVAGVDPSIKMGLMTVHLPAQEYLLSDWTGMASALGAVKVRPGGGYFNETQPDAFIPKICGVAGQMAQLGSIADRQYELEDWPLNHNKSGHIHTAECTAALMAGCNGIAFASVPPDKGNEDVMDAVASHAAMWNEMVTVGDSWKLYGATAGYGEEYGVYAYENRYFKADAHAFFNREITPFTYGFMPYTPYQENSCITVITEDMVKSLSSSEIRSILSKGVMMDGGAANVLKIMGYGDLIGISSLSWGYGNVQERYTSASLNGAAAGTLHYMYGTGFFSFTLKAGAIPLSHAENTFGTVAGVTSYAYENSLGGRVAVFGYLPWDYLGTWHRLAQTDSLVEWMSRGQLPVKVTNEDRVISWIKQPNDRSKFMLMLVNGTLDDTVDDLTVRVLGDYSGKTFVYYGDDGARRTLPASAVRTSDGYTYLTLPKLDGWGYCVVFTP